MSSLSTVAIIGAGASGLAAAKSAKEVGLEPTVFEKSKSVGGLWGPEGNGAWNSMATNLSRFSCMFSDFPWKKESKMFPHRSEVHKYLKGYAKHFGLYKSIRFSSCVSSLRQSNNRGTWEVKWINKNKESVQEFDFVIVCSGFFSSQAMPNFVDQKSDSQQIDVVHSWDYKDPKSLIGKAVAVVGGSFSGTEIAAEVAQVADSVIHISSRKFWILPRYLPDAKEKSIFTPLDLVFYKRKIGAPVESDVRKINRIKHQWFSKLSNQATTAKELKVPEKDYHNPPYVVISDGYLKSVQDKKIQLKPGRVVAIKGDKVLLEDQSAIKVDTAIVCSGFFTRLPFFCKDQMNHLGYQPSCQFQPLLMHKTMFHPKLPNCAFIGMYRGPYFGIIELQARWASMAFAKPNEYYPSKEEMEKGLKEQEILRSLSPRPQFPQGNYVGLADTIAKKIGVYPTNHIHGKSVDQKVAEWVKTGPVIPSHYRLEGSHANEKVASEVIMECNELLNN